MLGSAGLASLLLIVDIHDFMPTHTYIYILATQYIHKMYLVMETPRRVVVISQ